MILSYRKDSFTEYPLKGNPKTSYRLHPTSKIRNYLEAKIFFDKLFVDSKNFYDLEFSDTGKKFVIYVKFKSGPFNEVPILFRLESDYTKEFEAHVVLNAVLGALSKNRSYFIVIHKNSDIKIDKGMELMELIG